MFDFNQTDLYSLVVGIVIVSWLIESILDVRQYKRLRRTKTPPSEISEITTKEAFLKSQNYSAEKLMFGMIQKVFSLFETLCFLHFNLLFRLWTYSSSLYYSYAGSTSTNESEPTEGNIYVEITISIIFAVALILYTTFSTLPFSLYQTFVIEEKYGFNKQTLPRFFKDLVLGLTLAVVIGMPVLAIIIFIVSYTSESFWIWVSLFLFLFSLFFITIFPIFIAPLFNKFTPLPEGSLRSKIETLAKRFGFPLTAIYVVDGSTRSSHSNAYLYGFLNNQRIVIYDTLFGQVSEDEIVAILAHEIGHWYRMHNIGNLVTAQVHNTFFLWLTSRSLYEPALYRSFGFVNQQPIVIGLMLFQYLYKPIEDFFSFLLHFVSRSYEYSADQFASESGFDLRSALTKIHVDNLASLDPDPWYSTYHYSHPALLERLRAIGETKAKSQ